MDADSFKKLRFRKSVVYSIISFFFLSLLQVFFVNMSSSENLIPQALEPRPIKGRILVQALPEVKDEEVETLIKVHGGKKISKIQDINVHIIQLPEQASEKAVLSLLRKNSKISFAEQDMEVPPHMIPNDSYFGNSWHHMKIQTPQAWDMAQGDGVIIAVLDTGVNSSHPDLSSKMLSGWNFFDNNNNTSDVHGHGTLVAGSVAALSNNGLGVTGVSLNSRIMPIRISGLDGWASWSHIASGVNYAANNGARVVNNSYMGACSSATVQSAAQYMRSKGGVVVGSAGNESTLHTFAASSYTTCVGATDSSDNKTSWSNWGAMIDLVAPGAGIYTTTSSGGYSTAYGTSFSSPIVAGVYALMMSANPQLSPTQLDEILFSTVDDLGSAGYDISFGHGRLNAARAVAAAKNAVAKDTELPTVQLSGLTSGSIIKGTVTANANASDNISIARVDLYLNNQLLKSVQTPILSHSIDTTLFNDGVANLLVSAFDTSGNSASSNLSVIIGNSMDTTPPQVVISNPTSGSLVKDTVLISATASDNKAVQRMELVIDGKLVFQSAASSLNYSWVIPAVKGKRNSSSTISVTAYDAAGNKSVSTVKVNRSL